MKRSIEAICYLDGVGIRPIFECIYHNNISNESVRCDGPTRFATRCCPR